MARFHLYFVADSREDKTHYRRVKKLVPSCLHILGQNMQCLAYHHPSCIVSPSKGYGSRDHSIKLNGVVMNINKVENLVLNWTSVKVDASHAVA